jgi:hypothetical protein
LHHTPSFPLDHIQGGCLEFTPPQWLTRAIHNLTQTSPRLSTLHQAPSLNWPLPRLYYVPPSEATAALDHALLGWGWPSPPRPMPKPLVHSLPLGGHLCQLSTLPRLWEARAHPMSNHLAPRAGYSQPSRLGQVAKAARLTQDREASALWMAVPATPPLPARKSRGCLLPLNLA